MRRIWHGLILVFLTSCSKTEVGSGIYEGDVTLSGTVRDEMSGQPIPFATAMILRKHRDAGWGGMSVLEKTQCDSLGQFALSFYADTRDYVYSLDANALTYFDKNLDGSDLIEFTQGQHVQQDVTLMPHGYFGRIIKGSKGGNELSISWGGGGGVYYKGMDTISFTPVYPTKDITFTYWVFYIDESMNYSKKVVLPPPAPHDTTYYLIEF